MDPICVHKPRAKAEARFETAPHHHSANSTNRYRRNLLLPPPQNMGIHFLPPRPQRLPAMARLRPPHAGVTLGMDRDGQRRSGPQDNLLHLAHPHVHSEFRPRGLGHARARAVPPPAKTRHDTSRFIIRHVDVPNTYVLQLD